MQVLDCDVASVLYCGLAVRCVCCGIWGVPDDALQVQLPDHLILAHPTCQHPGGHWHHRHLCVLPRDPGCPEGKSLHAYNCKCATTSTQYSNNLLCPRFLSSHRGGETIMEHSVLPWVILIF